MERIKKAHAEQERYEVRLSGSGGQGMVFAGMILAEAVGVEDGKNVCQTQSYGPEARGGASRSDLVISKREIFYPKPQELDLLLAMTQEACDIYFPALKEKGTLVVDSGLVTQLPDHKVFGFPFTRIAREQLGSPMTANIVALGTISALIKIVSKKGLLEVLKRRAPRGTEERNLKAIEIGYDLVRKKKNKSAKSDTGVG